MTNLIRDENNIPVAGGVSSTSATTVLPFKVDSSTGRLLVDSAAGAGTVTSVSVVSANGFAGTVATATTTPAITLTTSISSAVLAGNGTAITAATTTGSTNTVVLQTSPTLITPVLGVATATSINGLIITTTTGTFTLTNAKTFAVTNTLTLSGTDSTTMTFPATSDTVAGLGTAQTFTAVQTNSTLYKTTPQTVTVASNAGTCDITHGIQNFTNSSAATMTITLTTTSASDGATKIVRIFDFSAVAQTVTWVGTENSTVTAPATSNGSTTLPLTVGFQYNSATSKWRCIASA